MSSDDRGRGGSVSKPTSISDEVVGGGGRGGASGSRSSSRGSLRGDPSTSRGFKPASSSSSSSIEPMPPSEKHEIRVAQKLRPPGTAGEPIELIANYFKIETTDAAVTHYDVRIGRERRKSKSTASSTTGGGDSSSSSAGGDVSSGASTSSGFEAQQPEQISLNAERFIKRFATEILEQFIKHYPAVFPSPLYYAFDGYKNLYTVTKLGIRKPTTHDPPTFEAKVSINIDDRPETFVVRLKEAVTVYLNNINKFYFRGKDELPSSERLVSVYEVILRYVLAKRYQPFQRKLFDLNNVSHSPKVNIVDFVPGFICGVKLTEFGLALNVHLKTSCIIAKQYTQLLELVQAMIDLQPGKKPQPRQLSEVTRLIRHLRTTTNHSNRTITYTIDALIDRNPYELSFVHNDKSITVAKYFEDIYGMKLIKYPLVRTTGRKIHYIPLELCHLPPNQFLSNSKLSVAIQRELLHKSTNAPNVYFNKLVNVTTKLAGTESTLQEKFGIGVSTKPVAFQGRKLATPRQLCAETRVPFYKVHSVPEPWAVFCFDPNVPDHELKEFVEKLMDRARFFGLRLAMPCPVTKVTITDAQTLYNVFFNLSNKRNPEFVFVGIPSYHETMQNSLIYSLVKHFCDQRFGIMSACFRTENAMRIPTGYFDHFLQKVNGKCGGLNSVLEDHYLKALPFDPATTMVVGIDVNHPSETETVLSSVAAAVGSVDPAWSEYYAAIRVQKKERDEIVNSLDEMIAELIEQFRKVNNVQPTNIIVFRDGISEGMFGIVNRTEIPLIQAGINKCGKPTRLTVIVTQKHHNTRIALAHLNETARKPTYNVPSGTVVDTTITSPQLKMFFLNSHFSPLGTSKITKYVILRDDLNMSADDIQQMCFLSCYNSIRTRKVIAIPTAVRYADLCAYRSKLHIEAQREITVIDVADEEGVDFETGVIAKLNEMVKVSPNMRNRLYYC